MRTWLYILMGVICLSKTILAGALQAGFEAPPAAARPWILWYWMDGQIDQAGITQDLESIARNGFGGVVLGDITHREDADAKVFLSPAWQAMFAHTLREAKRLGLVISTCPSAGWCSLGGPWVKPEDSMQTLVWSTVRVKGPQKFSGILPHPQTVLGHYRDVDVVAIPAGGEPLNAVKTITTSPTVKNAGHLIDGDPQTVLHFKAATAIAQTVVIEIEFTHTLPVRGIAIEFTHPPRIQDIRVETAVAGGPFRCTGRFSNKIHGGDSTIFRTLVEVDAPQTEKLRIIIEKGPGPLVADMADIDVFGENFIPQWIAKSGVQVLDITNAMNDPDPHKNEPLNTILLTDRLSADGRLTWDVPPGDWMILRFGHTALGAKNRPARTGEGLETDKFSRTATQQHFDQYMGMMAEKHREHMGSTLVAMWQDSWETGSQNWNATFPAEFKKRRGYDGRPYLPAMTGRCVGAPAISDRFLWDIRRTIADLSADHYLGALTDLGRPYGLGLWFQPINRHFMDGLQAVGRATGAEANMFFDRRNNEKRSFAREKFCASAAHGYGQNVIHSEAATAPPPLGIFVETPAAIRELVNANFCAGINNHWMHVFLHQPWPRAEPGLTWRWGLQFQRNTTWFEKLSEWSAYVTRGQYMLRQGLPVVDVVCFLGEDVPSEAGRKGRIKDLDVLPPGIDYDLCNAEIILTRMSVHHGRIVLPDGMRYALLYLPKQTKTMRPEVLRKIHALVLDGATLVGDPPDASPSLENYPGCDAALQQMVKELWGADPTTGHRVGRGQVYPARGLSDAMNALGIIEDFTFSSPHPDAHIEYSHRQMEDVDIYFVANRGPREELATCVFRVTGKQPEIWRLDTGGTEMAAVYNPGKDRTAVPLRLLPHDAVFVVFQKPVRGDPIVSVARQEKRLMTVKDPMTAESLPEVFRVARRSEDEPVTILSSGHDELILTTVSGRTRKITLSPVRAPISIAGAWEVSFPPGKGAPDKATFDALTLWNDHPVEGIQYFSGTATYRKTISLPAPAAGERLYIDLGKVHELATVRLNGQTLGTLWKEPFRLDITNVARNGDNDLEIEVVNLWVNRLIGDERMYPDDAEWAPQSMGDWRGYGLKKFPAWFTDWTKGAGQRPTERVTFSTVKLFSAQDPLCPSGLAGPVRIISAVETPISAE